MSSWWTETTSREQFVEAARREAARMNRTSPRGGNAVGQGIAAAIARSRLRDGVRGGYAGGVAAKAKLAASKKLTQPAIGARTPTRGNELVSP